MYMFLIQVNVFVSSHRRLKSSVKVEDETPPLIIHTFLLCYLYNPMFIKILFKSHSFY